MRPHCAPPAPQAMEPGPAPTFSVVIAAYQAAGTAGEAVASALDQTYPALEVIVCDDGSTDGLESALAADRERIVLLRQQNRGPAAARNACFRVARGDFVVILDADDVFLPDRLEALAELASARPDLDVLTTDATMEREGSELRRVYEGAWTFDVVDQRRAILERNFIYGEAAVRRRALMAVGGMDESFPINPHAEDWDLWIRLILSGSTAGLVAEPLVRYRLRPENLSAQRDRRLEGKIAALGKALSRPDLSGLERRAARREAERLRGDLAYRRACRSLREDAPDARRRCLDVLAARPFPPRAWRPRNRARALLYWLAPGRAGRRLRRQGPGGWEGPGGIVIDEEHVAA